MKVQPTLILSLVAVAALAFVIWPDPGVSPDPVDVEAPGSAATTDLYASVCARCHGAGGQGDREQGAPSIGGQPEWYLILQLEKFRSGQRGAHPDDVFGQQMRQVALSLTSQQRQAVVARVSKMPAHPTRASLGGDLKNGRLVYEESCMECHRYNGSGEYAFRSSPLTAFQDWYLARELNEFRSGIRGSHPDDADGQKMRKVMPLLTARDVRDVASYIAELAKDYPPGR